MSARRRFRNDAHAIAAARRFAAEECAGVPAELVEQIQLMLSELATNAIRHAGSAFEVSLERRDQLLKVAVTDEGGGTPTLRSPSPKELSGRGLQIVKMLARDWGIDQSASGPKTVWFTVTLIANDAATNDAATNDAVANDAVAAAGRRARRASPDPDGPPAPSAPVAHRSERAHRRPGDPRSAPTARACRRQPDAVRAHRPLARW
ncbi:MAG: ATP-binding protein [Actinomycetota bacterium]|nr:ATP-binding protein [Actinomycetota bacterium]